MNSAEALVNVGFFEEKADGYLGCCEKQLVIVNPLFVYQYSFLLVMCQHDHAAHRCCLCVAGGRQRRISPAKAL